MIAMVSTFSIGQSIAMILLVIAAVAIILLQAKRAADRECEHRVQLDEMMRFLEYIERLRMQEGDELTILCNNREADHIDQQCAITCQGDWTDWNYKRFEGRTVLEALEKAALQRRLREDRKLGASKPEDINDGGSPE